ncbi:putative peptide chain release factor-like protein [Venturia nashicola]|uniref:Putative peptide chain release factor-like protein n=1 Tax=Venturia nashicola TaxID=86259 RepID=A0A4Z1PER8_9PEZI|nr:putative peptide chain release factor-like protein [Venturia nashicola]
MQLNNYHQDGKSTRQRLQKSFFVAVDLEARRLYFPPLVVRSSSLSDQGQNKTASAVQLKHLPTGLVVKCQATRSRDQNRKTARKILAEKLDIMELGDESRTMIKAREVARKKASKRKKSARKYRKDGDESGEEGGNVTEDASGDAGGIAEEMVSKAGESRPSGRGTQIGDRSLFGSKKDLPP